jgi:hypothetical protein
MDDIYFANAGRTYELYGLWTRWRMPDNGACWRLGIYDWQQRSLKKKAQSPFLLFNKTPSLLFSHSFYIFPANSQFNILLDSVAEKDVIHWLSVAVPRYPHRPTVQDIAQLICVCGRFWPLPNQLRNQK